MKRRWRSHQEFAGSLGTQVVKVLISAIARTGLRDSEAYSVDLDAVTVELETWDRCAYYPGAYEPVDSSQGERQTGRLLGAQTLTLSSGSRQAIFATALFLRHVG